MVPAEDAHHVVRFYERDAELCGAVAEFVEAGLIAHERVILVATAPHWGAIQERLPDRFNVRTLLRSGTLVFVDATEAMRRIRSDNGVSTERFRSLLQSLLPAPPAQFRIFGELVALVANSGELDMALEIEMLGQELAQSRRAHVLCAYNLGHLHDRIAPERIACCHDAAINQPPIVRSGARLLLADDFQDARDLYREYLEFKGYRVTTAADGLEAVEQARMVAPDLVLLDIRMPRMGGIEAMQTLKGLPQFRGVPIVALTAHALESERQMFLSAGFDAVLAKPCLPEEVAQTVEALLSARSAA